jgi:hypothetical protein
VKQELIFKRDAQGWQSRHDGKLVVAHRNLAYHLNSLGSSLNEHKLEVDLEKMFGDFYVAN